VGRRRNDTLKGGKGRDQLFDRAGQDHLLGGGGNDVCMDVKDGVAGDSVNGGAGSDGYWIDASDSRTSAERLSVCPPIVDF
jgi:Ca2+-binding RTX toxin-like protein